MWAMRRWTPSLRRRWGSGDAMTNGIHPNTTRFATDTHGKVVGVSLQIVPAGTRYRVKELMLLDEYMAQGKTVAFTTVLHGTIFTSVPVTLGWPFNGDAHLPEGVTHMTPVELVITNGYNPPNLGPLAIYVGQKGRPESPIVGGLGLPNNRHVCYKVVFELATEAEPEPVPPTLPPVDNLRLIAQAMDRLQRGQDLSNRALSEYGAAMALLNQARGA